MSDPRYDAPEPGPPRRPEDRVTITNSAANNARWGWIAGAAVLALLLVFVFFRGTEVTEPVTTGTAPPPTQTAPPQATTPPPTTPPAAPPAARPDAPAAPASPAPGTQTTPGTPPAAAPQQQ